MKPNKFTRLVRLGVMAILSLSTILAINLAPKLPLVKASYPSQVATGSSWLWASFPVENFQEYTSPFGPRGGEFHYGLDLAAPQGSYIRNWWSGQVVEVIADNRCGIGLVIESGSWEHIYCHMEGQVETANGRKYLIDREGGIQLWEGQQVPVGARIGRVGMSGRTSGPHLHWGLKYSKQWVDPATVLRAMYNEQFSSYSSRPQGY
ncbi:MAG: M23 family metallopeptidase [Oscillatoriaceae bacterium SKW80]|nr:M23 family metallopeptidase [Oscillatoriaceae bacterium SKYG93]MCX8119566.1 M23 family metallopeptidase [Oscillatoriaceae bacterium SKW80]MDW8455033.1 M23 family metallopeptidase [Oscillatoriaceae cyanobacterium SKYGB_i_bin93]